MSPTKLIKQIRRLEQYEQWKRAVFLRDRFTCQHCGARNGRKRVTEADHIIPLSVLIKENQISTPEQAIAFTGLWDITNGRTLCHSCHEKTESYPQQFRKRFKQKKSEKANKRKAIRIVG